METSNGTNMTSINTTHYPDMLMPFEPTTRWGFWVKFILTPIIVFIGIIGNSLSLIVMKSKPLRRKSYSHYLSILAVFDTITLITRQIKNIDEYYVDINNRTGVFQNFSDVSCKIYDFLEHVSYLMSSWLVVMMAIERFVAVCFPFKKVLICKQSGAAVTICCLLGLICVSQVFRLTMIEHVQYEPNPELRFCAAGEQHVQIYTSLEVYLYQWTLAFVLPVSTVLFCNMSVVFQVIKVRREVKRQKEKTCRSNRLVQKQQRTTFMLLLVSFTYIATLLPLLTLTLVIDIAIKLASDKMYAWNLYTTLRPFLEISVALSLLNYAINFFIYVLSGKSFRFELLKIFKHQKKPKRVFTARSTRDDFLR